MRNKKGLLRIIEAFMAILLIIGVVFVVLNNRLGNSSNKENSVFQLQESVLKEIRNDDDLRADVLDGDLESLNAFIRERIPKTFEFEVKICELNNICPISSYKEKIYADEIVISSTLQQYSPKKLKLFMWEKD